MHSNKTGEVFFPREFFSGEGIRFLSEGGRRFQWLIWAVSGPQRIHQKISVAFSETSIEGGPQGPNSFFSNDRAPCGDLQPRGDLV